MLVSMATLLADAKKNNYCLAAPNAFDENHVRYILEVAEKLKAPIIVDITDAWIKHESFVKNAVAMAKEASTPVAVNLDHGKSYEGCMRAIRWGFSSVMIDKSTLPYEDCIREVADVVKVAHAVGVTVESELGHVCWQEEGHVGDDKFYTQPDKAKEFVERTGIDCLAVAIGNVHGDYTGEPHIDFERLAAIQKEVDIPLVLHGGSGTGDDNLVKAIGLGINKINLFSDLSKAGYKRIRECQNFQRLWPEIEFEIGYKSELERYIRLFKQNDRL